MEYKKLSIPQWAAEDRPREKSMQLGIRSLTHSELIALIIHSGSRKYSAVELSRNILDAANNSLHELAKMELPQLLKINGIGHAKALSLMAALELGRRREQTAPCKKGSIHASKDAFRFIQGKICDLKHEEFWVIYLNRSNRIQDLVMISAGGISGTVIDVRIIMRYGIEKSSSALILVHNHPSGNINPSEADIKITEKIKNAAISLDIQVLDHLIVADNDYFSFADEGML